MKADMCAPVGDDWSSGNLIRIEAPAGRAGDALPTGWEAVAPNPALAPRLTWGRVPGGAPALAAEGNGREECFGYLRCPVHLEAGKTYRLRVQLRCEGLEDIDRHLVHGVFTPEFNDGISSYRREGDCIIGEGRFTGPEKPQEGHLRLYFRYSARGHVWWERVSLQECEPVAPRLVRVACSWGWGSREHWTRWLDRAGEEKVDVALLPEFFHLEKPGDAASPEPLDGPLGQFMAAQARQHHMYVCGTFGAREGDLVHNAAPLFDREGQLVGVYRKNMLYDPEADEGTTPGIGYPVFKTDFGNVGVIICYDSWYPETVRLLAYKGAELILFPSAGYYGALMTARAADNGVWIAASSLNCPAGVWDPSGTCGGEYEPHGTRYGPSSIRSFEKDDATRMVIATLDLSRRTSPHWWGGPLRSAPGGRRCRQTLIVPIEEEIAREARRWWVE